MEVYVMSPLVSNEHQRIASRLVQVLRDSVPEGATVLAGANVSDRREGGEHDHRCPDVVVLLRGSRASDAGTHGVGGPDFLVAVVLPHDRSRDKLAFHGTIGVREVLLVERDGKALELYRGAASGPGGLIAAGTSSPVALRVLVSEVFPIRLSSTPDRAELVLTRCVSGKSWRIRIDPPVPLGSGLRGAPGGGPRSAGSFTFSGRVADRDPVHCGPGGAGRG